MTDITRGQARTYTAPAMNKRPDLATPGSLALAANSNRRADLVAALTAADGTRLAMRRWGLVAGAPARGTVLIVHGLGEHIGRYEHVASRLCDWGFEVVGYDHRGHGLSQGPRGGLRRDGDLLDDLARILDRVREESPGPIVLLGHSMGGQVAARFVAGRMRPVDALVLSSPALDVGLSAFHRRLLRLMLALAPDLGLPNGLDADFISHDREVVRAYRSDPLVHGKVTARLVRAIVDGGAAALEAAAQWQVSTLLMWAGADRLVAPRGSAGFAAKAPPERVQSHCFETLYHELFNEPEKEQVFAMLRDWLDQRFPPGTAS